MFPQGTQITRGHHHERRGKTGFESPQRDLSVLGLGLKSFVTPSKRDLWDLEKSENSAPQMVGKCEISEIEVHDVVFS